MRNIPLTLIWARVFVYVPSFISQILDFIYRTRIERLWFLFWSILNGVTLKTSNMYVIMYVNILLLALAKIIMSEHS